MSGKPISKNKKPGIYWNGTELAFGLWVLQDSGKLYFSGTPVAGSKWTIADTPIEQLKYLCSLDGKLERKETKK